MHSPPEIDRLLSDFFAGAITRQQMCELEDWLREDPAHIRYLADYGLVEQGLVLIGHESTAADILSALAEVEAMAPEFALVDRTEEVKQRRIDDARRKQRQLAALRAGPHAHHGTLTIPKPIAWLGLAAALGLAAWLVAAIATPKTTTMPQTFAPGSNSTGVDESSSRVARLTGGVDVRWEAGASAVEGEALYAGQTLKLASGFAELTTATGATVVLEGPCELVLLEHGRFQLLLGRVGVEGRHKGSHLTIQTPGGEVTHTQAAYGLSVGADRATQVVCYGGRVELFAPGGRAMTPDPFELVTGRSALAEFGDLGSPTISRTTAAETSSFALSLSEAGSLDFLYRRAVLADGPVAYWTFDEDLSRSVPNLAQPGTHDLRVFGTPSQSAVGVSGKGARLDNLLPPYSFFVSSDEIDALQASEAYTIELWYQPARRAVGTLVNLHTGRIGPDVPSFAMLQLQGGEPSTVPGWRAYTVRGMHRDPPGRSELLGTNLFSTVPYRAGEWHHAALAKSHGRLRLYVDGALVSETMDHGAVPGQATLVVGILSRVFLDGGSFAEAFSGQIDELAVYDRALSPEELAERIRLAPPKD